jgi:hypothetical protein
MLAQLEAEPLTAVPTTEKQMAALTAVAIAVAIAHSYVALPSRGPLHCKLLPAVDRRAVVPRATLSAAAVSIAA